MSKLKDTIIELNLDSEQLKDKEIQNFVLQVAWRKQQGDWIQFWNGNGYCEINKKDGTQITTVLNNEDFKPGFPLNIDCALSTVCNMGCQFCYFNCTPNGKHSDIRKFINDTNSFLYSLQEGTEIALDYNEPRHPDLHILLEFLRDRGVLANITLNEISLLKNQAEIENWLERGLVHGIGISPNKYSHEMIEFCQNHPTAVIHTIAGITTIEQYHYLANKDLKILILGYKNFGRGVDYRFQANDLVVGKIEALKKEVKDYPKMFKVVSFDNLAIKQLNPKEFLSEKEWETFYRGDDGSATFFLNLVDETFAKNSIQPKEKHKALLTDVKDMLKIIQKEEI